MAQRLALLVVLVVGVVASAGATPNPNNNKTKTYIVFMSKREMPATFSTANNWYDTLSNNILYKYDSALNGFAARMTEEEMKELQKRRGVVSVAEQKMAHIQTTRTPMFLGLKPRRGMWPQSKFGKDVIVGVLDTGVWPESPSFNDSGYGLAPSRWRGSCEGANFKCNNKIIGARFFYRGFGDVPKEGETKSPRDMAGHGTHVASTIAGVPVPGVSYYGYANGTATGMAPQARLAIYKVCWTINGQCTDADILAGIDAAARDGVDVLNLSLGKDSDGIYNDPIAVGVYGAMERGVFVACAAGNSGPYAQSVMNVAPWITTVAASTSDRDFPTSLKLGNNKRYPTYGFYMGKTPVPKGQLGLIYAGNAALNGSEDSAPECALGSLDPKLVKGKIVVCDQGYTYFLEQLQSVIAAYGSGVIFFSPFTSPERANPFPIPAAPLDFPDVEDIKQYISKTRNPTAEFDYGGTILGVKDAPQIASFSAHGPSFLMPQVLKPDITAPGVNVLAAWRNVRDVANPEGLAYNMESGTSMATPHVSGIAAMLKAVYPDWTPAAIRSAIMTSANPLAKNGGPIIDMANRQNARAYAMGAGQVFPQMALRPGLVYDITARDYLNHLCLLNYTNDQISLISRRRFLCIPEAVSTGELNYPSFSVFFPRNKMVSVHSRTVTFVGKGQANFTAKVSLPKDVTAVVRPARLEFKSAGERLKYSVTFTVKTGLRPTSEGEIIWSDGIHTVRSPIVFGTSKI